MITTDPNVISSDLTLRDQYTISYAEYLHSYPGLWRITVDYLCTCGDIGKQMADQILMRVPLMLQEKKSGADEDLAKIRAGDLAGVLKEVNATCFEHQREEVRRMVCRVRANPSKSHDYISHRSP